MAIFNTVYGGTGGGGGGGLPKEYQEVEYIQSSGTQWIDTGLYANQNTVVETKWNLVQYNSAVSYDKFYGTYGGTGGSNCFFLQSNKPENYKIRTVNYHNDLNTYKITSSSAITTGTDYTVKHSATEFWLNGVLQGSCSAISYTSPTTITIFAVHDGNSVTQNVYLKLYSFKMYSGTTLERDFVPCYRKADGVIGLYDLVGKQFYTNSGTGTFTKGPDIWQPGANTKFYLPLTSDILDHSGNSVTTSGGGTVTYQNPGALLSSTLTVGYNSNPSSFTIMGFFKATNTSSVTSLAQQASISASGYYGWDLYYNADGTNNVRVEFLKYKLSNVWKQAYSSIGVTSWHHICLVCDNNTTGTLYVDGVQKGTKSISGWSSRAGDVTIGGCYAGNVIFEDKARTAQEIADYYNQTKGNYGIS